MPAIGKAASKVVPVPGAVPSSSLVNCNLDQAGRGWAIGLYAMLSADEAANADGTEALHRRLDRPGGIGQSASLRPAGETRLSPMPFGKFRPVAPRCRMASVEDRTPSWAALPNGFMISWTRLVLPVGDEVARAHHDVD